MKISPNAVTPIMPKNTAVPSDWRISAPAPIAHTSGVTPKMKDKDVITIGRSRKRAASIGGLEPIAALLVQLLGEFDDQDRVLGGKADQHDESHLRENVVLLPAQQHADDRRHQAHRNDQDDGERQREAFELRRQHEEHEHHREHKGEHGGIAGAQLLECERRPFVAEAVRQRLLRRAAP